MVKQWLSHLEPVHRAELRQEREAVHRFRYRGLHLLKFDFVLDSVP